MWQRRVSGVGLVLLVPALQLSGCAGSDDSDASAKARNSGARVPEAAIDACALVTAAEAASALGVAMAKADRPSEANTETRSASYSGGEDMVVRLRTCRYVGELGQGVAVLTVMVRQSSSPVESRTGFEGMRQTWSGTTGVTDVPGLGEQAYWRAAPPVGLQVLDGALQLSISGDIDAEHARDLAAKALQRLE